MLKMMRSYRIAGWILELYITEGRTGVGVAAGRGLLLTAATSPILG
jgi:hypothetical protein